MMRWEKLGRIFDPERGPSHSKLASHAANPLPIRIDGDLFRVFFSGRDAQNRSSVGAVDIDIARRRVERLHDTPFFLHGEPGSFYADGVSIGNSYAAGDERYILFMAWQAPKGEHWRGEIGRLIVTPELTLALDMDRPFISRNATDPVSLSYPWVMPEGRDGYTMWYGSTLNWDAGNGEMLHVLRSARSADGHDWTREGETLPYQIGVAQAFSRPTVVPAAHGGLDMWFCYRGAPDRSYRIGHAHKPEGASWELRLDLTGIDVSSHGWDCEMIAYPFVLDHEGERLMLYNGNGYGRTGFGLARLVGD